MSLEKISQVAMAGAKKLSAHMLTRAPDHDRVFKGGPEWNFFDSLIPGPLQSLRYTFDNVVTHEIIFATGDLEAYAGGNADAEFRLERKVDSLLRKG